MRWYYVPEMDRVYHTLLTVIDDFGDLVRLNNNWPRQRAMAMHFSKQEH